MPYRYQNEINEAVGTFWMTKTKQKKGKDDGVRGGKHLNGFRTLLQKVIADNGMPTSSVHVQALTLPGFYRQTKNWDLVVVHEGKLVLAVEFKSQTMAEGKNFNNRAEEALGNAVDFWAAFDAGLFGHHRPWLGWLMVFKDEAANVKPAKVKLAKAKAPKGHFSVLPHFANASYTKRYELLLSAMVKNKLCDSAALIVSQEDSSNYGSPSDELGMERFLDSLGAHVRSVLKT